MENHEREVISPVDEYTEGMTNCQYKGMLLDQLEDWQRILDMAIKARNA